MEDFTFRNTICGNKSLFYYCIDFELLFRLIIMQFGTNENIASLILKMKHTYNQRRKKSNDINDSCTIFSFEMNLLGMDGVKNR